MQHFVYNIGIGIYYALLRVAAVFHPKARLFIKGREGLFKRLEGRLKSLPGDYIWIHAASLGEFEQGRPIIEAIRAKYGQRFRIILTFYSPSGYEVRKNYDLVDIVSYLPVDSHRNARRFITLVNPKIGILIKYEFWINYLKVCEQRRVSLLSVSSIFRSNQLYFKPFGAFQAQALQSIDHFYVQNQHSRELLSSIDIKQVTVTGDTRFDRVKRVVDQAEEVPLVKSFVDGKPTMVMGSIWENDLKYLRPLTDQFSNRLKFIVAPHNIEQKDIEMVEGYFQALSAMRFSNMSVDIASSQDVLIIDNMGMLSSLYRYGQYAYIGGALNKGLHNILEAVTWQVPVFYWHSDTNRKFDEVMAAEKKGIGFPISDVDTLAKRFEELYKNQEMLDDIARAARNFVSENIGATDKVMHRVSETLEIK